MDRSHGGRVTHEADEEQRMTEALTQAMVDQAGPATFITGKSVRACTTRPGVFTIAFDDGSGITFRGDFAAQYHAQLNLPEQPRHDIEGEVVEETELERRLGGGDAA